MSLLGIDTSNYTTSVAVFHRQTNEMHTASKLLTVPMGNMGLRQSEAVFQHTKALPELMERAFETVKSLPVAVGVSVRPRDAEGSYMPCFLAGKSVASSVASVLGVPLYEWSHQVGHVAAVAFGANRLDLLKKPFIAFHFSGGTTDGLLVKPKPGGLEITQVAGSLDLKAGQAVDRVGGMLGLSFPAGKALDPLAMQGSWNKKIRPVMKGADCCLSGIENQCKKLIEQGTPKEDVARFCMESIYAVAEAMTAELLNQYGNLPIVYAGGVMSNTLLQQRLKERFDGIFAPPVYSSDNAMGVAILTHLRHLGEL